MNLALQHITAFTLFELLGIKDNTIPDSNKIEEQLNVALPTIIGNPKINPVLAHTVTEALTILHSNPVNFIVTDKRCEKLALIMCKLKNLPLLVIVDGELFDQTGQKVTLQRNHNRCAIFVTCITDGEHVGPMFNAIRNAGGWVNSALCFIDYGFPIAVSTLESCEGEIYPFLDMELILDVAEKSGIISYEKKAEIMQWQKGHVSAEAEKEVL